MGHDSLTRPSEHSCTTAGAVRGARVTQGMKEGDLAHPAPTSLSVTGSGDWQGWNMAHQAQSQASCPGVQLLLVSPERLSGPVPVGMLCHGTGEAASALN